MNKFYVSGFSFDNFEPAYCAAITLGETTVLTYVNEIAYEIYKAEGFFISRKFATGEKGFYDTLSEMFEDLNRIS